jgi:hypothetical protein
MSRRPTPKPAAPRSPAHERLDKLLPDQLRRLMRTIPTANVAAIDRASIESLRDAAHSYLRTGKLAEAQVINWEMEP